MTGHRITLLGSQDRDLKNWLNGHPDGHERGALVLFRRFAPTIEKQLQSDRFCAVEVIKMSDDWVFESSMTHLRINMRKLADIYFRCETEKLELGFAHNHPTGHKGFSAKDDTNELNILHGLSGCNGKNTFLVTMLLTNDKWSARIRHAVAANNVLAVRHISVVSDRIELHGITFPDKSPEILKRQEAAFGKPFNSMLQSLRVVVVGVGGTGSPVATLLARAGVGELILIDGDILDKSNMNRVRGYCSSDVGENKAQSLAKFINSLGLDISVSAIDSYLSDSGMAIDALSCADVIFGCTDDLAGRDLMNQALYYYALPYIDVGLTGKIDIDQMGDPYLRDHWGRVSCILPESGACLRCQRVVTDEKINFEQAVKDNPDLAKIDPVTLQRDHYLSGGGEQAPGVGPFTSGTADNAVATFMNLLRGFRSLPDDLRQDNIWIDFIHMCIQSNAPVNAPDCPYCRQHLLLLKQEGKYRLDMPSLGERF